MINDVTYTNEMRQGHAHEGFGLSSHAVDSQRDTRPAIFENGSYNAGNVTVRNDVGAYSSSEKEIEVVRSTAIT